MGSVFAIPAGACADDLGVILMVVVVQARYSVLREYSRDTIFGD